MSAQTLAEAWEARAAESALAPKAPPAVQERRAFYAGALAAAALSPQQVLRECIDFAKTIGSKAETAT